MTQVCLPLVTSASSGPEFAHPPPAVRASAPVTGVRPQPGGERPQVTHPPTGRAEAQARSCLHCGPVPLVQGTQPHALTRLPFSHEDAACPTGAEARGDALASLQSCSQASPPL